MSGLTHPTFQTDFRESSRADSATRNKRFNTSSIYPLRHTRDETMTSSFVPSARISMTVPTPLLSDASARRSVTTRGCGEVCYQVGEGGVGRGTRERERERRRGMRRRPLFRRRLQPQPRGLHSCVTQCTPRAHLALSHSLAFPRIFPDPPARGARVAERRRLHESTLPRFNQPQDGHFDT